MERAAPPVSWTTPAPGVWVVTLDNPPANALGDELLSGLASALEAAEKSGDAHVMIITSEVEGMFAAGADLRHMSTVEHGFLVEYGERIRAVIEDVAAAGWITIAALDGATLGGGLELALACTFRIASKQARLGLPEVRLGLIPAAGGTQRLPRVIGQSKAIDLMLTGRSVGADEALRIGLVDRVADDALQHAVDLATTLSAGSLEAQRSVVRCVDAAVHLTLHKGLSLEADESRQLLTHGDAIEGIRAFLQRRPARFKRPAR